MTDQTRRQGAILRLVRERETSTQSELVDALRAAGHDVVQTTVSRDVHELGLTKVRMPDGSLVYAPADAPDSDRLRGLGPALQRWALTVESSGNLVVVTTPRGYAAPLAYAFREATTFLAASVRSLAEVIFLPLAASILRASSAASWK